MSEYEKENLPVLIVSLLDASVEEQAFQFIVINNKAVRVPTENVKSIIANIDEEKLQDRLLKAGVKYGNTSPVLRDINDSERSPFKNLLDWQYNNQGTKLVPLTAIEQSLRYLKAKFKFLDEDDDSLVEIFFAIWRSVKNEYEQLWGKDNDNNDNKLMKKVSINALNEYIVDNLFTSWTMGLVDIFDSQSVEKQVFNMMKLLTIEFW